MSEEKRTSLNFVEQIIEEHNASDRFGQKVHTRFPPEPNGYLHIGHAKSIYTNFSLAKKYGGKTNLRFDDTNPVTEDTEYVESIQEDIKWLGFDWEDRLFFASDYFEQLYTYALDLIKKGKAYVDDSTAEEIAALKGTPTRPGEPSPYRSRTIEENLDLFERMRKGEFEEGSKVLRAKIDMSSPNMLLRDPVLYRIKFAAHHRTGDKWCIYPMYDMAHGYSDSIEGITHSVCTLEFENHRPLYDWLIDAVGIHHPQQIEFSRLNPSYMITSKRKLRQLVEEGHLTGWNDPRMPTISGLRRRGYTPESICNFAEKTGLTKRDGITDVLLLEDCVRQHLNKITPRMMAVLSPLKITITNYPEDKVEMMEVVNNPEDESAGTRELPFSNKLYIETTDFMEDPPRKYFRLAPGKVVRLKGAYIIQCDEVIKDDAGEIIELKCSYIENSKSGEDTSGVKAKGTIHWVSVPHAEEVEVRLYDRLFTDPTPGNHKDEDGNPIDFKTFLNPESLQVIKAQVEPSLQNARPLDKFQFMRKGYFCLDPDSTSEHLIFNRTVTLRDSWAKKTKK